MRSNSNDSRREAKKEARKKARKSKTGSGLENTESYVSKALSSLVPQFLARRTLSVSVETDKDVYEVGESVDLKIEIKNGLPFPVDIQTPKRRLWGWKFDGLLEASDEKIYTQDESNKISFRGKEVKTIEREWRGKIKRETNSGTEWVVPERGDHEIEVFVATGEESRPTAKKNIKFR